MPKQTNLSELRNHKVVPVMPDMSGYHRCAAQMELGASVEVYWSLEKRSFLVVVDKGQIWGPFNEAQMLVACNAFNDIKSMQGIYNAIPG